MVAEMEESVIISKRLKKIEDILDLKPTEMADLGGCSQATYYRYRKGKSIPDSIFLKNIIKNENRIKAQWLLMGSGPILTDTDNLKSTSGDDIDFSHVPFYEMQPQGGKYGGVLPLEKWQNPSKTLPLCNIFLNQILKTKSDRLFALRVNSDSMNPEIKPDSLILVNQNDSDPRGDGIFVIRLGKIIQLKLLQYLPNNRLHLTTINKKYDAIEINPDEAENFKILGRIIWAGTPYN